jgi:two-component system response regulator YesN
MRTIRLLIADDEPVIIRGLRRLLPWGEMGFEIVGEAYDGLELRRMLDVARPDVILSDINMPGLTGIDILREINENGRNIKVIFISAYQEFSYAQDAVKFGAIDYLLKPVDKERLQEVMRKIKRLIGDQSERVKEREMVVRLERQKRNSTIEEMLICLTDGDNSALTELKKYAVLYNSSFISICYCELDKWEWQAEGRWKEEERRLLDFSIANVIVETLEHYDIGIYFRRGKRHGVFIQHETKEEAFELANELHRKINQYLKISVTIGLGEPVASPEQAVKSAASADMSIQVRYFQGPNQVLRIFSAVDAEACTKTEMEAIQQKLVACFTGSNIDEIEEITECFIQEVGKHANYNQNTAITSVYSCLLELLKKLKEQGVGTSQHELENDDLLEQLAAFPSYEAMTDFAKQLISEFRLLLMEKLANKDIMQLAQVKAYIEEHYDENITLESMAALVFMNPYYFSRFFKKHVGENFKQYLTDIRMRNALKLLLQTDLMIYEIAEQVGYQNSRQFSDMFKKKYGKLPLEYKQSIRGTSS